MRTFRCVVALTIIVLAGGCAPRRIYADFPGDAGRPPVRVDIVDPGGLVESVDAGAPNAVDESGDAGIFAVPTIPTAVVVTWTGGPCDIRTTATVGTRDNTIVVSLHTDRRTGVCLDMGIHRAITIDFSKPIADRALLRELEPRR